MIFSKKNQHGQRTDKTLLVIEMFYNTHLHSLTHAGLKIRIHINPQLTLNLRQQSYIPDMKME